MLWMQQNDSIYNSKYRDHYNNSFALKLTSGMGDGPIKLAGLS